MIFTVSVFIGQQKKDFFIACCKFFPPLLPQSYVILQFTFGSSRFQWTDTKGWVRTKRGSKAVNFIALNDGSTINNIQVVAYSSLGVGNLLQHSVVLNVARRIERTPAQVLLRWGIQKGVCVIPKASSTTRIEENYNIFDFKLNMVDMEELDSICKEYPSSKHFCWNPENVQY